MSIKELAKNDKSIDIEKIRKNILTKLAFKNSDLDPDPKFWELKLLEKFGVPPKKTKAAKMNTEDDWD